MRHLATVIACVALAPGAPLAQVPRPVAVGARVQVTLAEAERQKQSAERGQRVRGTVLAARGDTLVLRLAPGVGPLAVPVAAVRRLEVSHGVPSRGVSALRAVPINALVAAVALAALYDADDMRFGVGSRAEAALLGAAAGAFAGATVGALWPHERWRRVPLPRGGGP